MRMWSSALCFGDTAYLSFFFLCFFLLPSCFHPLDRWLFWSSLFVVKQENFACCLFFFFVIVACALLHTLTFFQHLFFFFTASQHRHIHTQNNNNNRNNNKKKSGMEQCTSCSFNILRCALLQFSLQFMRWHCCRFFFFSRGLIYCEVWSRSYISGMSGYFSSASSGRILDSWYKKQIETLTRVNPTFAIHFFYSVLYPLPFLQWLNC